MGAESANGLKPDGAAPEPADEADGEGSAFERFERLTKQLLSVPKAELDRHLADRHKPIESS